MDERSHRSHRSVRPAFKPARAWRGWTALLLTGVASLSGCYTTRPVSGVAPPGAELVLQLSDRGRTALGDSIGPSADQIRGTVESARDSSYVLRVASVQYLNGQTNRWTGEPLTVRMDLVNRTQQRQFSRSRTWGLGLGVAAAILAVALSTDLLGNSSRGATDEGPGQRPDQ